MRLNTRVFSSLNMRSLILGIVITCACLAFVFTGFGSLNFTTLTDLAPGTAASVDGENIGIDVFASAMDSQNASRLPPDQRRIIARQVINQLIEQEILVQYAKKVGWVTSEIEIATFIRAVPAFQNPETQTFDLNRFKAYLANQQTSELKFYAYLKRQLELQKMKNLLLMPVPSPERLSAVQYQIDNTEFPLQYAIVTSDTFPKDTTKLSWKTIAKPYKTTTPIVADLGNAANLAQNVFKLKKPGDVLPKVINFGTKKAIIKLAGAPVLPKQTDEQKKLALVNLSQQFAVAMDEGLISSYQKDGKIRINPILFN